MLFRSGAFGIAAGLAPTITGHNFPYETGSHLTMFLEAPRVIGRLGVRAEAFFGAFSRNTLSGAVSRRTSVPGASLYVVLPLVDAVSAVRPYVVAGAGTYRTDLGGGPREIHFGYGWGGGVQFGRSRVKPYAEVRVLRIADGGTPRIVPLSLGVRF